MNIIINHEMKNNIKNKTINLGIQILRVILCFWVISFHSLNSKKINYFLFYITKTRFFHVPCFSFISFFFAFNILSEINIIKVKGRLQRLLIPYIIWPIIVFITNNIFDKKGKISLYNLKIQLILGSQFMIPLWFLFSSIMLTMIFFFLSYTLKKNFLFVCQLLMIFSYMAQYSYFHQYFIIFNDNVRFSLLGTFSIFPICITGFIMASLNILNILREHRIKTLLFSYLSIYFLLKYDVFIDLGGHKGIMNNFAALSFFFGFYLLPFEHINSKLRIIIKSITNYTNGIYCLQSQIIPFSRKLVYFNGTLKGCIMIYLISFIISFIGNKLLHQTKLKYLFI